jgi:hypothetical protein
VLADDHARSPGIEVAERPPFGGTALGPFRLRKLASQPLVLARDIVQPARVPFGVFGDLHQLFGSLRQGVDRALERVEAVSLAEELVGFAGGEFGRPALEASALHPSGSAPSGVASLSRE